MSAFTLVVCAFAATAAPRAALGDDAESVGPLERPRPVRWDLGAGGFASVSGPDHGPLVNAALYPGGAFGRLGARASLRGFRGFDRGAITGGVTYEAAAARPRLQIALYAEIGATYGEDEARPVAGGGAQTQLWLLGPIALGADAGASLLFDGVDTELLLAAALTLRLAN